ncbi:MAG: hypothetical protein KatS3mg105_0109 [Gemmatales bacterium]|nr:MAG: hypothetical protein KatS3mg105_0109 [Gemmatales bacterium]
MRRLLYELALQDDSWHYAQHFCFFSTGLLFWYPVIQPYPSRPRFDRWLMIPYLLLADVQNTALSALFAFSDRLFYSHYANVPRLWDIAPLDDQAVAGAIMWVPGSLVFLLPLLWIVRESLYGRTDRRRTPATDKAGVRLSLHVLTSSRDRLPARKDLQPC